MKKYGKHRAVLISTMFAIPMFWHDIAAAQDCDRLASHILSVEAVYSEQNVCNWVTRRLTKSSELNCSYEGMWRYADDTWKISVMPVTSSEQGFIEHSIDVSGPGSLLSGNYRVGYERLVSQLLLFFSSNCVEKPYLYLRLAHGNRKDRQELEIAGGNTEIFDPGEGWTGTFKEELYAAIRSGVEDEIAGILGEAQHD